MIRKSLFATVIITGLVALLNGFVKSQTPQATPETDKDTCSVSCPSDTADCHLNRARYLIVGLHFPTRGCPDEDYSSLATLKGLDRSLTAVAELEKAIANSPKSDTRSAYIYKILAAAKITLGNSFLAAGRYEDANKSFTDAYDIYITISKQIKDTEDLISLGSGMIRTGKLVEAIKYLTPLPNSSSTRAYLLAEAYFSLNQREASAKFYENWIDLRCQSYPTMILEDEYGLGWMMLTSNRPRCAQLPVEIRSRLEFLHRQFGRPKNLPAKNYPGSIWFKN